MKDQPYPSYKNSNIWWLGDIPHHWKIVRLKYCVNSIIGGGTPESANDRFWSNNEEGIPFVTIGDMTKNSVVLKTERYLTKEGLESKGLQIFPVGTFLYSIFASLGKVAILGIRAAVNQAILGIEPDTRVLLRDFLKYWMNSIERNIIIFSSSNTQDNLTKGKVRLLPIYIPPLHEQKEIISFLDGKIQKIDAIIKRKKQQIELLQENRIALISNIVTKGLNPNISMKDTGIEWLGEIPNHWEVYRLKYLSSINDETLSENTDPDYEFYYVDISNVDTIEGIKHKELLEFGEAPTRARRKVKHGDIIISTVRTYLRAIAPIVNPEPNLVVSTGFAVVRPYNNFNSQFASYALRARARARSSDGVTVRSERKGGSGGVGSGGGGGSMDAYLTNSAQVDGLNSLLV